jgi:hypothetical protein
MGPMERQQDTFNMERVRQPTASPYYIRGGCSA